MNTEDDDKQESEYGDRDEVEEVKNLSRDDTKRIKRWRLIVVLLLLATATIVTFTTYTMQKKEQANNFKEAFAQFSRTCSDAVIGQQQDIRRALKTLSHVVSSSASLSGAAWPFFAMSNFEIFANDTTIIAGAEGVIVAPYVSRTQRNDWIAFVNETYKEIVKEGHLLRYGNLDRLTPLGYHPYIGKARSDGHPGLDPEDVHDAYAPAYLSSPPPQIYGALNWNFLSDKRETMEPVFQLKSPDTLVGKVESYGQYATIAYKPGEHTSLHSDLPESQVAYPHSLFYHPVFEKARDHTSKVVASILLGVAWDRSLRNLLPQEVRGIVAVLRNTCGQQFTYRIDGFDAFFIAAGDHHDPKYDSMVVSTSLDSFDNQDVANIPGQCLYTIDFYPDRTFANAYFSNTPESIAFVLIGTFMLTTLAFVVYDVNVAQRNRNLVYNAAISNEIVTSLFPGAIGDRLRDAKRTNLIKEPLSKQANGARTDKDGNRENSKPLADLFLHTTVLYADVAGFTAWCSVREPCHVFTFLETIYGEFDSLARLRRVFKVETVGDRYVAVTGLPDPRCDHAVVMARFASGCQKKFSIAVKKLEVSLGPDTGDLQLRMGMHSGPVTGGILRGDRARFQLFGDTMNTAAGMESTAIPSAIQASEETANELRKRGKSHWLDPRSERVNWKGKGDLQTYWICVCQNPSSQDFSEGNTDISGSDGDQLEQPHLGNLDQKKDRLISWNTETLLRLLKQVVAHRLANSNVFSNKIRPTARTTKNGGNNFFGEVKEIIELPLPRADIEQSDVDSVEVGDDVIYQLREFVSRIAGMYCDNPFHNFEHASHVSMAVMKLLSRIVAPTNSSSVRLDAVEEHMEEGSDTSAVTLHDHTYGITSDPLTQFACAFAALIHDVDHPGVPNTQLVAEHAKVAAVYKNRSVAEQNSLSITWDLLMSKCFKELREILFATNDDLLHFRQLVVNSVMATDIVDKELKALRNARWDKAFATDHQASSSSREGTNRKATIVIEHLIQAADVSHTMQHWHIYRKWNQRLFCEMYRAYKYGRSETNPADFWVAGEIGFFDFYIIPLAKKLKDCGVFGVSSDEFLNYALQNRREWELRGADVLAEMLSAFDRNDPSDFGLVEL